jgi:hypothetical protein
MVSLMSRCAATTFQDSGDMREDDPMQRERTWAKRVFQVDAVFNFDQRFIASRKYIYIYVCTMCIYIYNKIKHIYSCKYKHPVDAMLFT